MRSSAAVIAACRRPPPGGRIVTREQAQWLADVKPWERYGLPSPSEIVQGQLVWVEAIGGPEDGKARFVPASTIRSKRLWRQWKAATGKGINEYRFEVMAGKVVLRYLGERDLKRS